MNATIWRKIGRKNIAESNPHLPINLNALYGAQFVSHRICRHRWYMDGKNSGSINGLKAINRSVHFHDRWRFRGWIPDIIFTRDCFFSFRSVAASIMVCPLEIFIAIVMKIIGWRHRWGGATLFWSFFPQNSMETAGKCLDRFLF